MRTLDLYIFRQLAAVTLLGVVSLTLLMLLGQLFKELHALLVESGAPPSIVIDFVLQVIPFSLTFSVPWGFLTAVLLVYGRLAADNELTSMRMAGLSLWRLSLPAFVMAILLSALCYYINIDVAPRGKNAMSELAMQAATDNPRNLLQSGRSATKLDRIRLFINKRQGDTLYGLHIYPDTDKNDPATPKFQAMHAQNADIGRFDQQSRQLYLTLHHATIEQNGHDQTTNLPLIDEMPLRIHIPLYNRRKMKPNRFTNEEIEQALQHLDRIRCLDHATVHRYARAAGNNKLFPCAKLLMDDTAREVLFYTTQLNPTNELAFRTEGVQRASFACACIVFSLIGVPLAITARRRDTSTGFALGILVAAVYFVALIFCELSRKTPGITPYIVLWLPNVLCVAFAIWQHHKALYRG